LPAAVGQVADRRSALRLGFLQPKSRAPAALQSFRSPLSADSVGRLRRALLGETHAPCKLPPGRRASRRCVAGGAAGCGEHGQSRRQIPTAA